MIQPTAKAEDHFEERLAALDEIVSGGKTPASDSVATGSTEIDQRLEKTIPALQMLDKYWRRTRNPSSTGQHKTLINTHAPLPSRIGKFEIIRELGRGGFGVVLLAKDTTLQYEVALKIPHSHALASAELRDRFRREAQVVAKLQHPNIITVHEAGDVGPISYIVYAYCPGQSLAEWLKNRREAMPVRQAAEWVATMSDAVAYAHDRGILHRDLKPANVMLSPEANALSTQHSGLSTLTPKITDFGLAKTLDSSKLTQTGGLLGTPAYMAPEQALKHKDIGPTADVHALGLILYELLTGTPPFRGESEVETLEMVARQEPVSPRKIRPKLPRDLETICMKCLQKDPTLRYASAQALSDDLKRFLAGKHIQARPVSFVEKSWRYVRRHPLVTGLTAALLILTLISAIMIEWNSRQRLEQAAVARTRFQVAVEGFRQQIAMGRKLLEVPSTYPTGRELLIQAITYYDQLLRDAPVNAAMIEEAAEYATVAGNLFREFGKDEDAEMRLTRAKELYRQALQLKGENEKLLLRVADSHMNLGHLYRHNNRQIEAEAAYREASLHVQRLADIQHDDVKYQGQYCYAVGNRCASLYELKRFAEAEAVYQQALKQISAALEQQPQHTNCQFQKGLLLNDYGSMLFEQGKVKEGEPYLREALELRQHFLESWPQDLRSLKYLALTHLALADLCEKTSRVEEARTHFDEAVQLFEKQLVTFPIIPERLSMCASTQIDYASFLLRHRDGAHAEKVCRTGYNMYDRCCREYPHIEGNMYLKTVARMVLVNTLKSQEKWADARALSAIAFAEYRELNKRKPVHEKMKVLHEAALQTTCWPLLSK